MSRALAWLRAWRRARSGRSTKPTSSVSIPEFWHVAWRDGRGEMHGRLSASSEAQARAVAAACSRRHGHATVTNRDGLVATYINGEEVS